MNLGQLIVTMGVNTAGLIQAARDMRRMETKMQASITRINRRLESSGAAMKKFGRSMSMYMTVPLLLVGGAAFKMHMSFESSMSKIVGLVGVAREQVDLWNKDILKIAPQLGKSPQELADALFFVTSAGLRGAEAMDVLEMSAKASAAGLGETKIVADLVTSAMNAYGSAVLNAEAATDVLVATVREGKAEAAALTTSMGMVLPIASNMGVAFNEVGAAIAAMTRTGTGAATASMQLRQILASLLKPTKQSAELLKEMGTSAEQVDKGFKAMGTSASYFRKVIREQGLLAALMEIKDLSAKFGEEALSTVFPNIRALSGVLDILGENLEDNIALFKRMGVTTDSLKKAYAAAAETAEHKWNVAITTGKTALTVLGRTIAESFLPILKSLTEKIQKLTDWFRGLSDQQRQMIVRIAGLVAAVGPLMMILGFLVGNILPGLIRVGMGAVKMFNALTIAMLRNPLTALAIGVTAIIAALITFRKKTDEAVESQMNLNKAWKGAVDLTPTIEEQIKKLGELNLRQVKDLQLQIQQRLVEERKFTVNLRKERFLQLGHAEEIEKKSLDMMVIMNQRRIASYKDYLRQVAKVLTEFKAGTALDILPGRLAAPERITGVGIFPTPPTSEKFIKQAQAIADAWVKAAEAGKLYDTTITAALANTGEVMDRNIMKWEELDRAMKGNVDVWYQIAMLMEDVGRLGIALIDRRITKLDEQYRRDIAGAKDNASRRIKIEEEYEKKRNALLRKAAIAEKLLALFTIAINTAKGVSDALSKVVTAPLAPWIAAAGILQAGIVAARPVPQFGEGAIVRKPTLGIFGEKGPEAIIPLNKLERQPITINVTVEGVARGEDIHYIVKEIERKHANNY